MRLEFDDRLEIPFPRLHEEAMIFAILTGSESSLSILKCPNRTTIFCSVKQNPSDESYRPTDMIWGFISPSYISSDLSLLYVRIDKGNPYSYEQTIDYIQSLKEEAKHYFERGVINWDFYNY